MNSRRARIAWWICGTVIFLESFALAWQHVESMRYRDSRPVGRVLTLTADLPVLLATSGEIRFTIPRGCRIQESTPRALAAPLERAGAEYVVVLRTGGGLRAQALLAGPGDWMDDYVVRKVEAH